MSEKDYSMSPARANLLGFLLFIPLTAVCVFLYVLVWGWEKTGSDLTVFFGHYGEFLLLIVTGVILHELIHGLTWMKAGKKSWKDVRFGFNWKALAPYAHCTEPIDIDAYRWGAAAPGIILGVVPFLIGLLTGKGWFTLFGYLFIITAAGDILMLLLLRKISSGASVQDHPDQVGCRIIED